MVTHNNTSKIQCRMVIPQVLDQHETLTYKVPVRNHVTLHNLPSFGPETKTISVFLSWEAPDSPRATAKCDPFFNADLY